MNLCDCGTIKRIMEGAGIGFRKDLGQNFLISSEVPIRCAEGCEANENTLILEIGPGIGCMTDALACRFRHVVAVEIDDRLIPVLAETLAEHDNVTVHHGDIMKTDIAALLEETKARYGLPSDIPVAVCANLPYYITTPILMYLVECGVKFSSITVMVQAEVADRLTAKAGTAAYGAISAVLAYYGEMKRLFTVPSGCFMPQPKVNSAVVRLALYQDNPYSTKSEKVLFRTIHAAFEQRRKTLLNALSSGFSNIGKDKLAEIIEKAGLPPQIRGEKLDITQFVTLSNFIYEETEIL
ncbi:MAG: 16S rRNA (adenine(1518)-N(6)/adenine(1519)-N(6))-dimethyltransferase RsmA [Clostridia bacterium]|nr:16S rRNA (adenine(1518)-N(6)/adenine(1519)-N(6))-dimethyltransferase RsmA [Clostridia bacterium]